MQLSLNLDLEPCQNHEAKLLANDLCLHEGWINWDSAYEFAWQTIEGADRQLKIGGTD